MDEQHPIIIYRSVNGDGETFALEPDSLDRVRDAFGRATPASTRVFVAHDKRADNEGVQGAVAPQVVSLLAGVSEEKIQERFGPIIFQDPVSERILRRLG